MECQSPKFRTLFIFLTLFLLAVGLFNVKLEKRIRPKPVHVLCYHDIALNPTSRFTRSPERLESDFQLLSEEGFTVISLEQAMKAGASGSVLPAKWVAITFDDATTGQYTLARPLLKKYHFPATFYIPTAMVDSGEFVMKEYRGTMNWQEIGVLAKDSFQIASHGHSHENLSRLSEAALKEEVRESISLLESRLGIQPTDLALPYGLYTRGQEKHFLELGIRSIALTTTDHGEGEPDLLKIRRFEVLKDTGKEEILDALGGTNKEGKP